jgi:membrane-associated phospholipid phosphatase
LNAAALPFELLVVGYLAFFAVAAAFADVEPPRRMRTALAALSCAVLVYGASRTLPVTARLWLAFLYIPLGYWIPVPLVPLRQGSAFERWLVRSDEVLRGIAHALPRWFAYIVEVGYLTCFPLIPISFAVVWIAGSPEDVARFWMAVLLAGYGCYITLPWLVSRPPRLLEGAPASADPSSVSRANVFVLGRVSHQLNTFPSGHVAVTMAAAFAAGAVAPVAGLVLGMFATGVALGAVAGRYHYVIDVMLGVVLGIVAGVAVTVASAR